MIGSLTVSLMGMLLAFEFITEVRHAHGLFVVTYQQLQCSTCVMCSYRAAKNGDLAQHCSRSIAHSHVSDACLQTAVYKAPVNTC